MAACLSALLIQVRQQHVERGVEFLCDELHLCDRTEASEHRIFFISAREALLSRSTESTSAAKITFTEGPLICSFDTRHALLR